MVRSYLLLSGNPKNPCCRARDVLRWRDIGWPGKGPVSYQLVLLQVFLVLDIYLRLTVRYVEVELRFLVDYTFLDLLCKLIAMLQCNGDGSILKKLLEVSRFLNHTTCFL